MLLDVNLLLNNPLFKDMDLNTLFDLIDFDHCILGNYKKGTLIVLEGDPCSSIGFVLSGVLAIQQLTLTGDLLNVKMFNTNDTFGAALYSTKEPKYPFTLMTMKNSKVLYMPFEQVRSLLNKNPIFNDNFISFLSSRVLNFKEKQQILQYKDVRSRLMIYLSNEYKINGLQTFKLQHSKSTLADIIGVARPSVSRELKKMADDHLIKISGQTITLLKLELF